jgi:excisionase family DNA binding protein
MAAQPTMELSKVLTVAEVAKELRLSRTGAYEGIARGDIPSIRIGKKILVPRAALEKLLGAAPDEAA